MLFLGMSFDLRNHFLIVRRPDQKHTISRLTLKLVGHTEYTLSKLVNSLPNTSGTERNHTNV